MSDNTAVAEQQASQVTNTAQETNAVISMVERAATNPDIGIDKLEKMIELQERVLDRNARMEYDAALAAMQAELPEVEKTAKAHNSMYAKFEHILAAIKPALQKHGFSITHRVRSEDKLVHVTGILSHRSGHREETTLSLPPDNSGSKNAVQAVASTTEYGRRYTMNSLLGIATKDADKDGGSPANEPDITDWLAKIDESADMDSLRANFKEAYTGNEGFPNNQKRLNQAKDAKKKELSK